MTVALAGLASLGSTDHGIRQPATGRLAIPARSRPELAGTALKPVLPPQPSLVHRRTPHRVGGPAGFATGLQHPTREPHTQFLSTECLSASPGSNTGGPRGIPHGWCESHVWAWTILPPHTGTFQGCRFFSVAFRPQGAYMPVQELVPCQGWCRRVGDQFGAFKLKPVGLIKRKPWNSARRAATFDPAEVFEHPTRTERTVGHLVIRRQSDLWY